MKLEEGMYVRTPLGITKFLGYYDGEPSLYEFDKLDEELWSGDIYGVVYDCEIKEVVLKVSFNIIDLIEVGDYVNGCKVLIVNIDNKKDVWTTILDNGKILVSDSVKSILPIKSIVTKEQFETISYKVK